MQRIPLDRKTVVSYFKDPTLNRKPRKPRPDPDTMPCPRCRDLGEADRECPLCEGEGVVPNRRD
jgi:hypothetical protein